MPPPPESNDKKQEEIMSLVNLGPRALLLCRARQWSTRWDARIAQLLLEIAELAEAIRGKRGNPHMEAGDVLLVLASLFEAHGISFDQAVEEAHRKIDTLILERLQEESR